MSFEKIAYLIKQSTLYFCRIDCFEDKNEGVLSTIDRQIFQLIGISDIEWESIRKESFINCWIESPHELALMWDCYGKGGVAIQTTASGLRESMVEDKRHTVYMAQVKYIDSQTESSQEGGTALNVLKVSLTKRKYYEQEKEVRLLHSIFKNEEKVTGIPLPINLKSLIKKMVVSPKANKDFVEFIKEFLTYHNLPMIEVCPSKIELNQ